jgi:hypothetical protein
MPDTSFFRFARKNCCNYSETGPNQKPHYCWLNGCTCELHPDIDMGCLYFVNAVLPLDKALESKWLSQQKPWQASISEIKQPKPGPKPETYRICACGKQFRVASNRQIWCPKCAKENQKLKVRRHRARKKQDCNR